MKGIFYLVLSVIFHQIFTGGSSSCQQLISSSACQIIRHHLIDGSSAQKNSHWENSDKSPQTHMR